MEYVCVDLCMDVLFMQRQPLEVFYKKGLSLKISQYSQENTCWNPFLIKLQTFRAFPVNIAKFLRTCFLKNICERLLLFICMSVWISGGFSKKSIKYRSSHQSCSIKKGVLKNSAKLNGKHLCQSLFLIKLQASGHQFADIFPV